MLRCVRSVTGVRRRVFFAVMVLSLLFVPMVFFSGILHAKEQVSTVIGGKASKKYHLPSCDVVKRIYGPERVYFISPEKAEKEGYKPCQMCRPERLKESAAGSPGVDPWGRNKPRKGGSTGDMPTLREEPAKPDSPEVQKAIEEEKKKFRKPGF